MKFYLAFSDPPTYHTIGDFASIEAATEWLNTHYDKGYIKFFSLHSGESCPHAVRLDQWIVSDKDRNIYPIGVANGVVSIGSAI